jgi:hypothetical protein
MDGGPLVEPGTERRRWWLLFALLALAASCWSLGAPLMTGHDESSQAVRSAAAARGEVLGVPVPLWENSVVAVQVPEAYGEAASVGDCFLGEPYEWFLEAPLNPPGRGACPQLDGSRHEVGVQTNQQRHPPIYPAVLGLPSLVFPDQLGVYLMRLVGSVVCAALLASGLVTAARFPRPRLAAVAALAALTPEIVYVAATMNTAGLETAAAFGLWMAALALAVGPAPPDARLVRRAGVALVALCVARPLSPAFAVAALVVAAVLAGADRRRVLWARRDVRLWLVAGAVATASTVAWLVMVQVRLPLPVAAGRGLGDAVRLVPWWLRGTVGVFGSTDVVPPVALHLAWGAVVAIVLVWALRGARRRDALVVVGLALAGVALLVSGQGLGFPDTGYWWQGRYVLPLLTGALLTAAAASRRPEPGAAPPPAPPSEPGAVARVGPWLLGLLVALQAWAWLYAARHYAVGYGGTINPVRFLLDPDWSPPYGPATLYAGLFVAALAAASALVWRAAAGTPRSAPGGGADASGTGEPAPAATPAPAPVGR